MESCFEFFEWFHLLIYNGGAGRLQYIFFYLILEEK